MTSSFDDRGLRRLQENLEELSDTHNVPFPELFSREFMQEHTDYQSFEAMLDASPFDVTTAEEFKAIPDDDWELFIRKVTRFDSWLEMQKEAGIQWLRGRLLSGLG